MNLAFRLAVLFLWCAMTARAEDPFKVGYAKLRSHITTDAAPTNGWSSNLRLLMGVEATEGGKHSVDFVEMTTVKPPLTSTNGKPWMPQFETNGFDWRSPSQPDVNKKVSFIWSLYPVEVRVFDDTGRLVNEGVTTVPFGLLTNGLAQLCRLSLAKHAVPSETEESVRTFASGFLWMEAMMSRLQTVPAAKDIWDKANCSFRWPSMWTMAKVALGNRVALELAPDYKNISQITTNEASRYLMPMDMSCNGRLLTRVQTIVGPAIGASALLGGIESIEATHPTKADHRFVARVLAVGRAAP